MKEYKDNNIKITLIENSHIIIEIFEYKKMTPRSLEVGLDEDLHNIGLKHFSFKSQKLDETYASFRACNDVSEIKKGRLGARYFFIKDPDGNFIEFIEK